MQKVLNLSCIWCICGNSENTAGLGEYKQDIFSEKPSNASVKILYLKQMSNNKQAYNNHQLWRSTHTKFIQLLKHIQHWQMYWKNHKLVYEYVRVCYLSKYSKCADGLLIIMCHFYIHHGSAVMYLMTSAKPGLSVQKP